MCDWSICGRSRQLLAPAQFSPSIPSSCAEVHRTCHNCRPCATAIAHARVVTSSQSVWHQCCLRSVCLSVLGRPAFIVCAGHLCFLLCWRGLIVDESSMMTHALVTQRTCSPCGCLGVECKRMQASPSLSASRPDQGFSAKPQNCTAAAVFLAHAWPCLWPSHSCCELTKLASLVWHCALLSQGPCLLVAGNGLSVLGYTWSLVCLAC